MMQTEPTLGPFRSTLWMASQEPALNDFLGYLSDKKDKIIQGQSQSLEFSSAQLKSVRDDFSKMILKGEEKLHRLCGLLADVFLEEDYFLKSVVVGRLGREEPFCLSQDLREDEIYRTTDLDLGNRLLGSMRFQQGNVWQKPSLVANFVEYQSASRNEFHVHKIVSRIKAEEEIWAKAVDEIFNIDKIVSRDKELRKLSFYIKDIFGIKFVVANNQDVPKLVEKLEILDWPPSVLAARGVPADSSNSSFEIIEVKDHFGVKNQKKSGWQAVKIVVRWWGKIFEIQVQSLEVYLREQEYLTSESHAGFKERREMLRHNIAESIPLFGFYLELLQWLFLYPGEAAPKLDGIKIVVDGKIC